MLGLQVYQMKFYKQKQQRKKRKQLHPIQIWLKGKNTGENENEEFISHYTLEMIFEERMIEGDYIIEEYREYEVFRDENGGILKSIPTSNYDYIRYYKEQ